MYGWINMNALSLIFLSYIFYRGFDVDMNLITTEAETEAHLYTLSRYVASVHHNISLFYDFFFLSITLKLSTISLPE